MASKPCRCGLDPLGPVCGHCDLPQAEGHSAINCEKCARLARMCVTCRKIYDTPSQRGHCEAQHIDRELHQAGGTP
jgi:DTW domain-containing protein YfiP